MTKHPRSPKTAGRLRMVLWLLGFVLVLVLLYLTERYLRPDWDEDVGFGGTVRPIWHSSGRAPETVSSSVLMRPS